MGTNYYLKTGKDCETCGQLLQPDIHIGKQSIGWKFLFHAHPELGIYSYKDYRRLFYKYEIVDEYYEPVEKSQIERIIKETAELNCNYDEEDAYWDEDGCRFCLTEFG